MQEMVNKTDEAQKLVQKVKTTSGQIEVLAERISTMPKEMDPKPLFDQLARLQQTKTQLELAVTDLAKVKPEKDEPVSFESLAVFRRGLKKLIEKGEKDKNVQTAIIKKVVHKITIKPNGFEIHFHVGKTYYSRELGNHPSSRIFSFEKDKNRPSESGKSAGESQNFDFLKGRSSSLLTNGNPTPT